LHTETDPADELVGRSIGQSDLEAAPWFCSSGLHRAHQERLGVTGLVGSERKVLDDLGIASEAMHGLEVIGSVVTELESLRDQLEWTVAPQDVWNLALGT
jgi:hypothetical protein